MHSFKIYWDSATHDYGMEVSYSWDETYKTKKGTPLSLAAYKRNCRASGKKEGFVFKKYIAI
jgi:hypothetical protein